MTHVKQLQIQTVGFIKDTLNTHIIYLHTINSSVCNLIITLRQNCIHVTCTQTQTATTICSIKICPVRGTSLRHVTQKLNHIATTLTMPPLTTPYKQSSYLHFFIFCPPLKGRAQYAIHSHTNKLIHTCTHTNTTI